MTVRTLLDALQERFPDSSKTTLRKMLQADRVRVNGNEITWDAEADLESGLRGFIVLRDGKGLAGEIVTLVVLPAEAK